MDDGRLRRVRFIEGGTRWPYARQTPDNDGRIGGALFSYGHGGEETDWLVVLDRLDRPLRFPRSRAIFLAGEPVGVKRYHPEFLLQFGTVVTTDATTPHPNRILTFPGLPWHAGIRTLQPHAYPQAMSFRQLQQRPAKSRLCSCIVSSKAFTDGHRQRLAFAERLQREFDGQIEFFGRGFREVADKNEALDDFRYHIAIENSVAPHYWTEKLADAYLRNCFPIYAGAPNVLDYFDEGAMVRIDIASPERAIATIRQTLSSDLDLRAAESVEVAKRLVMERYNVLAAVDRLVADGLATAAAEDDATEIRPESHFLPKTYIVRRALGKARRVLGSWRPRR